MLSVIWGLAFVAIRRADMELSPVNLTLLRWLIASGGFLVLAPFIGKPKVPIKREHIPRILLVSFLSVAGYHLSLNYGETIVSAGLAGLLVSIEPIFVVLLSVLFLKERIGRVVIIGIAVAMAGVVILSLGADISFLQIMGPLAVIFSAFAFASFAVGSKPLVQDYGALSVATWAAVIGTVFLLPLLSWNFVTEIRSLSMTGWWSVLYLAVLSTVVGNIILYNLVGAKTMSRLSIQLYLIPVVSLVGGILLLGEGITVLTIIGAALLLSATGLVTSRH
jgi:drug/metabolite transporter (DMT)-like permease